MIKFVLESHVALSKKAIFPRGLKKFSLRPRLFQEFYQCIGYETMLDDEIEGLFYAEDLQEVYKSDGIYKIEKILAEKKENGKVKVLVKGLEHDKKFNSWVPTSGLRKL